MVVYLLRLMIFHFARWTTSSTRFSVQVVNLKAFQIFIPKIAQNGKCPCLVTPNPSTRSLASQVPTVPQGGPRNLAGTLLKATTWKRWIPWKWDPILSTAPKKRMQNMFNLCCNAVFGIGFEFLQVFCWGVSRTGTFETGFHHGFNLRVVKGWKSWLDPNNPHVQGPHRHLLIQGNTWWPPELRIAFVRSSNCRYIHEVAKRQKSTKYWGASVHRVHHKLEGKIWQLKSCLSAVEYGQWFKQWSNQKAQLLWLCVAITFYGTWLLRHWQR